MENKTKILNLLGLAMHADKLVTGEGLTLKGTHANKAKLMFVAQDASESIREKVKSKSSYYNVPVSELFSQFKLSQATGRPRMVIRVTDAGFVTKIRESLKDREGNCMGKRRIYELAEEMSEASKDVVDKAHQLGMDIKNHMGVTSSE